MSPSNYAIGDYDLVHGFIEHEIFDSYKDALGGAAEYFESCPEQDSVCIVYITKRNKYGEIAETKQIAFVQKYIEDPEAEENE